MQNKQSYTVAEAQQKLEHYCSYQERCHQEVVNKLNSLGMFTSARDLILTHLIQENFLNETRFAQSFARGKFRIKKWGRNRIKKELKARHISDYNIKLGLKEISEEDYRSTFWALFEKRKAAVQGLSSTLQKKKIMSYMLYRGWETHLIYEALNDL
jgi:regulatory protein